MRLDLDTEVRYPTGERVGVLRRVVFDANNEVSDVVVATSDLISRNVIVPIGMLSEGAGGVTTLDATPEEFDAFDNYNEERVPVAPGGWEFSNDVAPGGDVFPATMYQPIMPVMEVENLDEGAGSLSQGTEIECADGTWGMVDEVLTDEGGHVYAIVGRPDSIESRRLIIPMGLVQEFSTSSLTLNCTVADLPTYAQEVQDDLKEPEF